MFQKCQKNNTCLSISRQPLIGITHAVFCVSSVYSILTELRQAKTGMFQIRSLKCLQITLSNLSGQYRKYVFSILISKSSVVLNCFNSSVRKCDYCIQGTGVVSVITVDVISLRSMRVLYSRVCISKERH